MKLFEKQSESFIGRHIGPSLTEITSMLQFLGVKNLEDLVSKTIPQTIRAKRDLDLAKPVDEFDVLAELKNLSDKNLLFKNYLGMGYSPCITPPVILRNILENPGWYTAYTPYQAEISQGRLEALLNFQTMVMDLTGFDLANASLLDEATAAAEAMTLAHRVTKSKGNKFYVSDECHPQTIAVLETRAEPLGIELVVTSHLKFQFNTDVFGAIVQYPTSFGEIYDYSELTKNAHAVGAFVVAAADILALALLKSPAEWGADIAIGSTQRFGVPLGYGGPHAAYMATKMEFKRQIPGRLVGSSADRDGKPALRLALQTREQHIRRDKATSNICTAQVLLAVMASMYAVYHGPEGIKEIATRVRFLTGTLKAELEKLGHIVTNKNYFDTITVELVGLKASALLQTAEKHSVNLRKISESKVGISLDETTRPGDLNALLKVFGSDRAVSIEKEIPELSSSFARTSKYLTHPVFNLYHSETEMLRYIHRLQRKDLSLTTSMIALGSCTMKLNASVEMLPITWEKFGNIHPFAPVNQTQGYQALFASLEKMLCEITGFAAISLQPNAGSQGEYAGLLTIRKFHRENGDNHRNICLIPQSAHGTNPASAVMAGMKVVVVACDEQGNIDVSDLKAKANEHSKDLAALMVTYPSTHGVFEEEIIEICELIHKNGGQVYMDGANMNAQVGLCRPGDYGADVLHLNLHKTFCIPHGGGGPGMGPIGVRKHLAPFLPSHPVIKIGTEKSLGTISAAPWGSANILPISWAYIRAMGASGVKKASEVAILNANYIAKKLDSHFPVLYKGKNNFVAHECIVDLRPLTDKTGVDVSDIAKRLMDYGFHAPTISFPVAGTIMIEPTESEAKAELDRFCDAMISIRQEITEIEKGKADKIDNVLKNAPHTTNEVTSDSWTHKYTREKAAFPLAYVRQNKFWPAVARIDNALGDKNFNCACLPMEDYT